MLPLIDMHKRRKRAFCCAVNVTGKNLRNELSSTKIQLNRFKNTIKEVLLKIDLLVNALAVIDTLTATQASMEEIHQCSIGCSSKADKVDEEWEKRVEESDEMYIW